jgi:hypothetical protein
MKYIDYNHINFCLQEELEELDNDIDMILETPKKDMNEDKINLTFDNNDNKNKKENVIEFNEEEKLVLEELEKENNENIFLTAGGNNNNNNNNNKNENTLTIQQTDLKVQIEDDTNYFQNEINVKKNEKLNLKIDGINEESKENYNLNNFQKINKKNFELIELNKENEAKYRKTLVYKNNVFSKVEIQGMVVDKKILGQADRFNYRIKLFLDDTTGVIEVFVWKSKKENIFQKIKDEIVRKINFFTN